MNLSGEELNKDQQNASKIVGWLFLCLDPSLQATLKNENRDFLDSWKSEMKDCSVFDAATPEVFTSSYSFV